MRARVYDPATAQFLTVDPLVGMTGAPYNYAGDNAVNEIDPTGLGWFGEEVLEELGTRYVGFVDGLTSPLGGGTAALRSDLGLNGGLNTCSVEYQVADAIGGYTRDAEGAVAGAYALAGAVADAGGASSLLSRLADETGSFDPVAEPGSDPAVSEVLQGKLGSITKAPLPPGSPSWADIADMPLSEIRAAAQSNEPGFKTILKLLTSGRFNKP